MRFTSILATGLGIAGLWMSAGLCLVQALPAQEQNNHEQNAQDASAGELQLHDSPIKGLPPRVAATEYQAHAQAGSVMIGAEFDGHSIPTADHIYSSEEYIVVEAGFFGPPGAHLTLSRDDFTLRITGRKTPLASEPFELVMRSLKDPEWNPPKTDDDSKGSKNGLTTGGGGGAADGSDIGPKLPPLPPKMPFPLKRAMELTVKTSMMEQGDRPLPQAGLLFFRYGGKPENIKGLELDYNGAAGKATLELQN
jgi:hypothetical protein